MADDTKKQSLKLQLQEARAQIAGNVRGLKEDLSVGRRFRRSVQRKPFAWYAGAAVVGLVLALIPRMGKKIIVTRTVPTDKKSAGLLAAVLTAGKLILDLGKPQLLEWIRGQAAKRRQVPRSAPPRSRPVSASRLR